MISQEDVSHQLVSGVVGSRQCPSTGTNPRALLMATAVRLAASWTRALPAAMPTPSLLFSPLHQGPACCSLPLQTPPSPQSQKLSGPTLGVLSKLGLPLLLPLQQHGPPPHFPASPPCVPFPLHSVLKFPGWTGVWKRCLRVYQSSSDCLTAGAGLAASPRLEFQPVFSA